MKSFLSDRLLVFRNTREDFLSALRIGSDEPFDFGFSSFVVDTKYRIGSGDSGTLKKFKSYGADLKGKGYKPVILILRGDNLPAAITACLVGGWQVITAENTFEFILKHSGFDLNNYLNQRVGHFGVRR
ncbi:MAG: hypothetical protein ACYDBJ_28845 [Aggregatilineales bacterium]